MPMETPEPSNQKKRRLMGMRAVLVAMVVLLVALGAWARQRYWEPAIRRRGCERILQRLEPNLRPGDVLFQVSRSRQSRAIAKATGSVWTHCGLVFWHQSRWQVMEASKTVRWTPLSEWIQQGEDLRLDVRRVDSQVATLDPSRLGTLEGAAVRYIGRSYDSVFGWSDSAIYCSELVWKAFRSAGVDLGGVQFLRDLDLSSPEAKDLLRRREPLGIRWEDSLVTPEALRSSSRLRLVKY